MGIIVPDYYIEQYGVSISNVYMAFSMNEVLYDPKMKMVTITCSIWKSFQARLDGERSINRIPIRTQVNDISDTYSACYTILKSRYPGAIDQL